MRQIRVRTCRIRVVRRASWSNGFIDQLRFMGLRFMLTPMLQPFHFAFFVRDLASTRRFYGEVLGCQEGRSTESWVDFDFFGNQISAHNTGKPIPTENTGLVEGVPVPMPHFGALLPWDAFGSLADRIRSAGVPFVLEPRIRYPGQPAEQATMFLLDPSGNALEFKSFRHPEHVFTA